MYEALAPALLAALCWSVLDVLRKRMANRVAPLPMAAALMAGQAPLMLAWAWSSGAGMPAPAYLRAGVPLILTNVLAPVAFAAALRAGQLSLTLPMLSFTPVWSALLSFALTGERPGATQWVGIVLVVVGALLLHAVSGKISPESILYDKGTRLMIAVSFILSMSISLDKLALSHAARPIHAAIQSCGAASGLLLVLAARRQLSALSVLRAVWPLWLAIVLCSSLATSLQLLALQAIHVSSVEAIKRAVGMLAALLAGWLIFQERLTTGKVVGAAVMVAGVWCVVLR